MGKQNQVQANFSGCPENVEDRCHYPRHIDGVVVIEGQADTINKALT